MRSENIKPISYLKANDMEKIADAIAQEAKSKLFIIQISILRKKIRSLLGELNNQGL